MMNYCGGGGVHYTPTKTIFGIARNSGGPEQEHQSIHWSATITMQNVHVQKKQVKSLILYIMYLTSSAPAHTPAKLG